MINNIKSYIQNNIDLILFALEKCKLEEKLHYDLLNQLRTLEEIKNKLKDKDDNVEDFSQCLKKDNIEILRDEELRRFKVEALEKLINLYIHRETYKVHLILDAESIEEVQKIISDIIKISFLQEES